MIKIKINENMKGMNDQMNKLRRDYEREKEALMSKHREELERIKFQNSLTLTETKNNYESRISELNLKINQLQETLDNIKSDNSSLLESTKKSYEDQIKELNKKHAEEIAKLKSEYEKKLKDLENNLKKIFWSFQIF